MPRFCEPDRGSFSSDPCQKGLKYQKKNVKKNLNLADESEK